MGGHTEGRRPAPSARPLTKDFVEVLPDVSGLDRIFSYRVPAALGGKVIVGTIVRVPLHGRNVRGWVVSAGATPPEGVEPRDLLGVVTMGPSVELVDLARWGAWRFAGRMRPLLLAASPPTVVKGLPAPAVPTRAGSGAGIDRPVAEALGAALLARDAVLRLPPAWPRQRVAEALVEALDGPALVLVESRDDAAALASRLRRGSPRWPIAIDPEGWAAAAAGGRVVVGTRNAVLAPGGYAAILVLDAHSEAYRSERVPSFDARVLASERAVRADIPVCFVSPCPPVELLEGRPLVTLERSAERGGWGSILTIDQREEDPRDGGYPSRLASLIRESAAAVPDRQVVCVLNRTGRARLLSCAACRSVQRCEGCGAAQLMRRRPARSEIGLLSCPRCGDEAQAICPTCGSARLQILRPGVARAREQLEALVGLEVGEVSGPRAPVPPTPVVVGTEAVLHRVRGASMVAFLDFDQQLLAPRFRGAEQALVMLARAARLTAATGGRVLVRTSLPGHEVVRSAQMADPGILVRVEQRRRSLLRLPPFSSLALVTGDSEALALAAGRLPPTLERRPVEGGFVARAESPTALAAALADLVAQESAGWAGVPVRVEVEPPGL